VIPIRSSDKKWGCDFQAARIGGRAMSEPGWAPWAASDLGKGKIQIDLETS
jgi:hypothetical protein